MDQKNFGLLILTGLGTCWFLYTVKIFLKRRKYRHINGPKTNGIIGFYFGHILELNKRVKNGSPYPQQLAEWSEKYGPIYKIQFLDQFLVSVNDPESIKKVTIDINLPKYDFIYDKMAYIASARTLGNGLVTETNTERWKIKRNQFNHGFHRNFLMNSLKNFNDNCNLLMEKLRSMADGKTKIVLANEINRLALDIIANVGFGINSDSIISSSSYLNILISKLVKAFMYSFEDPFFVYNPFKRHHVKETRQAINELRKYAKNYILQRIEDIENNQNISNDILSLIINNSNDKIDLEELVDDFLTIFVAGQETTSNTLAFAILELGLNEDVLEKARSEVDQVVGARSNITNEDLTKLEYINCVLKETLRKWPVAAEFSRFTKEDIELNGVLVPKNTWIEISPFVMGRTEKFFPNPEKFQPERFMKNSKEAEANKFSVGPRNCIGQNFAKLEAKMMLVKFIQNFDFKLDTEQSLKPIEFTTLRPKDGCQIYLNPRQS